MPLPPNTLAELQRDMAGLGVVISQIRQIEEARQKRLDQQHETGPHTMVRLLARIAGVGVETADMVLSRPMRNRRAVLRRFEKAVSQFIIAPRAQASSVAKHKPC